MTEQSTISARSELEGDLTHDESRPTSREVGDTDGVQKELQFGQPRTRQCRQGKQSTAKGGSKQLLGFELNLSTGRMNEAGHTETRVLC